MENINLSGIKAKYTFNTDNKGESFYQFFVDGEINKFDVGEKLEEYCNKRLSKYGMHCMYQPGHHAAGIVIVVYYISKFMLKQLK